jgi:hypothetical protein
VVTTQEEEQAALDKCREYAEHDADMRPLCVIEREPVFFMEWERSLVPGHIRSAAGVSEYKISKCCEYHFDEMFATNEAAEWNEATQSAVGPIHGAK